MFCFFPVEHFSSLYGITNIPGVVLFWVNDPLYGLILNGDDIADANFCPVSVGFAVACFLCLTAVVFVIIAGLKKIKPDEKATAILFNNETDANVTEL